MSYAKDTSARLSGESGHMSDFSWTMAQFGPGTARFVIIADMACTRLRIYHVLDNSYPLANQIQVDVTLFKCIYVYMYVFICVRIYVYIYIYIYICIYLTFKPSDT